MARFPKGQKEILALILVFATLAIMVSVPCVDAAMPLDLDVVTGDFLVNDDSVSFSYIESIAVGYDDLGNFIVIWTDTRNYSNKSDVWADVFFQRYLADGTPVGASTRVNTEIGAAWGRPSIGVRGNGSFIITWSEHSYDNILFQMFDSNGDAVVSNVIANENVDSPEQYSPVVVITSSGSFAIVWLAEAPISEDNAGIWVRLFDTSGAPSGPAMRVNNDVGTWEWGSPSMASDACGAFVIVWSDERNRDSLTQTGNRDIYGQRFDTLGNQQGANFRVNDDTTLSSQGAPSISFNNAGNFLVIWSDGRAGSEDDIYMQYYDNSGTAIGGNLKVNDDAFAGEMGGPAIDFGLNDEFVATWRVWWSQYPTGNTAILAKRFASPSMPYGSEFRVDSVPDSVDKGAPLVWLDTAGNNAFNVIWVDKRITPKAVDFGNQNNIYIQRFENNGDAIGSNAMLAVDNGGLPQWNPAIACNPVFGDYVIVWADPRTTNPISCCPNVYGPDIYSQRVTLSGTLVDSNIAISDYGQEGASVFPVSVGMDANSDFVVSWVGRLRKILSTGIPIDTSIQTSSGQMSMNDSGQFLISTAQGSVMPPLDPNRFYVQKYNSDLTEDGLPILVDSSFVSGIDVSISASMDNNVRFVCAYCDQRNGNSDIFAVVYDSSGPVGLPFQVNDDGGTTRQRHPKCAANPDGDGFIVAWIDERDSTEDIYARIYDASGTPQGTSFKVNDVLTTNSKSIAVATSVEGWYVIVWNDNRSGAHNIYCQAYNLDGSRFPTSNYLVNDSTALEYPKILPKLDIGYDTLIFFTWMDTRNGRGWDIFGKVLSKRDIVTAVEESESSWQLPMRFALHQNYPNPFNPETRIEFSLPRTSFVTIEIFNILGQRVRTLVNERLSVGYKNVTWNGRDDNGLSVSSGIYFYRIVTDDFAESKKMILLK